MNCECGMDCPPCESCGSPECECQCFEIELEGDSGSDEELNQW